MNLLWVAAITVFVLAEKILPRGDVVSSVAAIAFVIAGLAMISPL